MNSPCLQWHGTPVAQTGQDNLSKVWSGWGNSYIFKRPWWGWCVSKKNTQGILINESAGWGGREKCNDVKQSWDTIKNCSWAPAHTVCNWSTSNSWNMGCNRVTHFVIQTHRVLYALTKIFFSNNKVLFLFNVSLTRRAWIWKLNKPNSDVPPQQLHNSQTETELYLLIWCPTFKSLQLQHHACTTDLCFFWGYKHNCVTLRV